MNRVLIVDDESAVAASFARQFQAMGWEPVVTSNANEVVELTIRHRPKLVMLDVHGSRDGREALRALKTTPATANVAVAMISGVVDHEVEAECLREGAIIFLAKPLRSAAFSWLTRVLENRRPVPPRVAGRVLISDDDELVRKALERAARATGLSPVSEGDATRVVERAKELKPDLIVLDVNQVTRDGRQVLARLKADVETRDIRVVMLSAMEDQRTRHECLILGAEDYVVKPMDSLFFGRIARRMNVLS